MNFNFSIGELSSYVCGECRASESSFFLQFSVVRRIFVSRSRRLEDRILSRVPLRHGSLLLESGELPSVVDGGEDFPHEDEHEADGHDGADHAQDDAHNVDDNGTLFGSLNPDLEDAGGVVEAVDERRPAVVVIDERAKSLILDDVVLGLLHRDDLERALVARGGAVLVGLVHQRARLELEALDARRELLAFRGARLMEKTKITWVFEHVFTTKVTWVLNTCLKTRSEHKVNS